MLDLTGRVVFLEPGATKPVLQIGYLVPESITVQDLRLLSDDEGTILVSPNFGYRWAYNIQYGCWVEIGWGDYIQLQPLQGSPNLQVNISGLMLNDTNPMATARNNGILEIFTEKMGQIRPNVTTVKKIDGSQISINEAPFFIAAWHYIQNCWVGIRMDQIIRRSNQTITSVSQLLLDGYINYSTTRNAYQDIVIVDDYQLKYSNSFLVSLPNRNIDGLKYIPGTCIVKINYNGLVVSQSLFGHYYQNYSYWKIA